MILGPCTHFPTVFLREDCKSAVDKAFMQDIAPEMKGQEAHVVITFLKGCETYRVSCFKAMDENMEFLSENIFESIG